MICNRCIRAALRHTRETSALPAQLSQLSRRGISATTRTAATISPNHATQSAPRQGDPSSSHNPPAATSTSAAQPFSTPLSPSASHQDLPTSGGKPSQTPKSSCVAGTVLKGLNYVKGQQDPVALEDSEYPSWLWDVLAEKEAKSGSASAVEEGDLFSKSKKQRRLAAKALRREQALNPEIMAPKIPLHQQTIDLPAGDGSLDGALSAVNARDSLTRSLRKDRRSKIKEANFLKAMG